MSVKIGGEDVGSKLRLTYASDVRGCDGGRLLKFKTRNLFEAHLDRVKNDRSRRGLSGEFDRLDIQQRLPGAPQGTLPSIGKRNEEEAEVVDAEAWLKDFWLAKRKQQLGAQRFKERVKSAVESYEDKLGRRYPFAKPEKPSRNALLARRRKKTDIRTWIADEKGKPERDLNVLLNHLESRRFDKDGEASIHLQGHLEECNKVAKAIESKGLAVSPNILHSALVPPESSPKRENHPKKPPTLKMQYPGQELPRRIAKKQAETKGKGRGKSKRKGKAGKKKKGAKKSSSKAKKKAKSKKAKKKAKS